MAKRSTPTEGTLTERARRAQLIEATIGLVNDHGYAGASLSKIAERAGITKAAVLYYYPSKSAVVRAAYDHVITSVTERVGAAVDAADTAEMPAAYIRSMIGYLRENPHHTRMLTEAMIHEDIHPNPAERWHPLAQLIDAARAATDGSVPVPGDSRTLAIIIGAGINGIVAEQLTDPHYDTTAAAEQLVGLVYGSRRG